MLVSQQRQWKETVKINEKPTFDVVDGDFLVAVLISVIFILIWSKENPYYVKDEDNIEIHFEKDRVPLR